MREIPPHIPALQHTQRKRIAILKCRVADFPPSGLPVDGSNQQFSAFADGSAGRILASATFTPPKAPQVFTTFLLGTEGYGYTLVPQVDAPEYGVCKPSHISKRWTSSRPNRG